MVPSLLVAGENPAKPPLTKSPRGQDSTSTREPGSYLGTFKSSFPIAEEKNRQRERQGPEKHSTLIFSVVYLFCFTLF
jgi:hypothetical protein